MADGYWNRRYNPLQQQIIPHDGFAKRQRTDFEAPSGLPTIQTHNYLNDIGGPRLSKDAETIGSAYEHFLQNAQNLGRAAADPFQMGQPETRPILGGRAPIDEIGQPMALPPDASSTLYIEGLPSDSKRREVSHIFRPFVGYKEVRLVSKEAKRSGDTLILCFVDFINPACAATALGALQGYKMDENDRDSPYLRLQFSKNPGPRSRSGPRGSR